jgi:hypothetical protein
MSTPHERRADRAEERLAHDAGQGPEERLAHDAGERPETLEGRADSAEQLAKDAGSEDVPGIYTDAPEQLARDAGEAPVIVDRVVDVPEQLAKDAGEIDRE